MKIHGQCHCGNIRYEAEIEPDNLTVCHCDDCQKLTGSPFRVTITAPRSDIHIDGEPKIYRRQAENGNTRLMYFCPECGSSLFASDEDLDARPWGIRWGSINERKELPAPTRQIWCRSAVEWATFA
ncbi:GFA family protein, partial [Escherichia coli]|uniref:GFA family protein n=1 Tax=Escherichia coli TaxID=562 RepID=UPI00128EC0E7